MFAGFLGTLYPVLSRIWILGVVFIALSITAPWIKKHLGRTVGHNLVHWGCLLVCVSFAWQSLNQILWGVLVNGELDIGLGMVRFLLIIFPVLLIQVIIFLRQDMQQRTLRPSERVQHYVLGIGIIAAFFTSIAAYTLADMSTIAKCLYVPPPHYQFDTFNTWAKNICR